MLHLYKIVELAICAFYISISTTFTNYLMTLYLDLVTVYNVGSGSIKPDDLVGGAMGVYRIDNYVDNCADFTFYSKL